jgi:hypothetical protein
VDDLAAALRARALQARRIAKNLPDPASKQEMLEIAEDLEADALAASCGPCSADNMSVESLKLAGKN